MSNPWSDIYKNLREPYLQEKMAKKDYDGDGKIESGKDEYMGSRDKAIKKAMGKKVEEHHQKDADGNPIDHGDGTPSNVDETITLTLGDYSSRNTKGSAYNTAKRKGFDKKIYKAGGGLGSNFLPLVNSYEPAKVNKPNYSNWREDFVWDDNVDEAAKGKKLDVKEGGVKNKIEINPDDGLKEEKKKLINYNIKGVKKDIRDMSKPAGTAKIDYRNLYMGDNIKEFLAGKPGDGYIGHPNLDIKNPFAKKQIKTPTPNIKNIGVNVNKLGNNLGNIRNIKNQMFNQNSYEPQGKMIEKADVSEAKYEKGASTYGKASIRNKRMFGKGGNAAPPEERGAAISVRRDRHAARRGIKKGNKYHEAGKYRPEVDGVNKPEQERKGKNMA